MTSSYPGKKVNQLTVIGNLQAGDVIVGERTSGFTGLLTYTGSGGGGGAVDSVNGQTGVVVLDADDLSDASTTNKFTNAADETRLANTSGTNTGDQSTIVGITGTKAEFNTAVTDGDFLYVGDISSYTDEQAQDAVGAMVDVSLNYVDGTPLLQRAALTGDVTASAGSNTTTIAARAVTYAKIQAMSTGKLLGRNTASSGDIEEITDIPTAVTIGGAAITRVGGTDVVVADGGTGRSTATAYAPIVGGTTTTGALQSTAVGSAGQVLQSGGASAVPTYSTPTYPSASGTARKILVSDGTNNIYSTETYAVPGSSGNLLRSDGTNWTAAKASLTTDVTGVLPVANGGTGVASSKAVIQRLSSQTGALVTGTTIIPVDDTIPQNTEGDQYLTLTITPSNSANILRIDVTIQGSTTVGAWAAALFQDSTVNAITGFITSGGATYVLPLTFTHTMVAGTTSSTTFKVRAGTVASGTFTLNGQLSGRLLGGVIATSIIITEYQV